MNLDTLIDSLAIVLNEAYGLSTLEHVSNPNGNGAERHANQAGAILQLAGDLGVRGEVELRAEELRAA